MDFHHKLLIFFHLTFLVSPVSGRRLECIDKSCEFRSDTFQTNYGIPQGSVLGPVLFFRFINDLPDVLPLRKIIIFAGDVVFFSSHRDLAVLFHTLECTLQGVSFWYSRNLLALNDKNANICYFANSFQMDFLFC